MNPALQTCVYCGVANSFNKEHVVLRAFGKFHDDFGAEIVLADRVCKSCNKSFDRFERRHSQESFDAFFRNRSKVKGRRPNKPKPNPYKAKKNGYRPIIVKAKPPNAQHDILMEVDPKIGPIEQTSAQFLNSKTGELVVVVLTPDLTREELVQDLRGKGYENGNALHIHCREEEVPWVEKLFQKDNFKMGPPPAPYHARGYVEGGYRQEDFRSIAKIAFNYLLKFNNWGLTGHELCFKEIKEFICQGKGNFLQFCSVPGFKTALRLLDGTNHIFRLDANPKDGLIARIHLFATNDNESPYHLIRLGDYPFSIVLLNATIGHRFQIDSGETDSGKVYDYIEPDPDASVIRRGFVVYNKGVIDPKLVD